MTGKDAAVFLVTGGSGQVGDALTRTLGTQGIVVAPPREELDLADAASIRACIDRVRPRWIVNAGAYTAVDRAESDRDAAFAINAEAPRVIGEEAKACSAAVIHFSTDYVFNGLGTLPYVETDATGPLGVYGASKLAGEQALLDSGANAFIFRTSWVYGATGKNFLRTILKLAKEREHLRVVGDQSGAPTWSRDLAELAAHVVAKCEAEAGAHGLAESVARLGGLYHAAGAGETTWAGFAEEAIRQAARRDPSAKLASVIAIPTAEYPTPAARPVNSRLNCQKLDEVLGWKMMEWKASLAAVLTELGIEAGRTT